MGKSLFKRIGLTLFATAFALIPALNVSAVNPLGAALGESDETLEEDSGEVFNPWEEFDGEISCPANVQSTRPGLCSGQTVTASLPALTDANTERYIDIAVHSGAHGHFEGEAGEHEYTKTYYYMDPLEEWPNLVADSPDYVFMGWSTDENATEPNIDMGSVRAKQVGTDIYAIWSTKAYIMYHIPGGEWNGYQNVLVEYDAGAPFQNLDPNPTPYEEQYNFTGWNTYLHHNGEHYDAGRIIDEYFVELYAEWQYEPTKIDAMNLDVAYDTTVDDDAPLYKFTPSETAYYEVYTDGISSDVGIQGVVRVQDEWDNMLAMEEARDPSVGWGDVHAFYEMQAGMTYYIRFTELNGYELHFNAYIKKSEMATVTFHANNDEAWFGDDHNQKTRDIQLPVGKDIKTKRLEGDDINPLNYSEAGLSFGSWAATPEGDESEHSYLIVTGSTMDVYALFLVMPYFHFDFNGGYHPFYDDIHEMTVNMNPSYKFESPIDPKNDDPHTAFAGWSLDPHATAPDEDIKEGLDTAKEAFDKFGGQTLYAVYTDKITVTFRTVGGAYMMDDPSATVYENVMGDGHVFYGMAVMHDNEHVKHEGWVDQNGNQTIATFDIDGGYHLDGDTTFTSILKYELRADANGGYFTQGCGLITGCESQPLRVVFDDEHDKFSYEEALDITGTPVSDDASKRFLGYATSPMATEPNIIDGETNLETLYDIYAVWGDKEDDPDGDGEGDDGDEATHDTDSESEDEENPSVPNTGKNPIEMLFSHQRSGIILSLLAALAVTLYLLRKTVKRNLN